jgi:hypothetical protein
MPRVKAFCRSEPSDRNPLTIRREGRVTLDYGKGGQLPAPGTWRLLRMLKQDSDFDRMIK